MIASACRTDQPGSLEAILAEVAEELTRQLQAGVAVDVEAYVARHPEHAGPIRHLLPALERLADLGRSGLREISGTAPPAVPGPDVAPRLLGDYRLLREVGRGGMGVVYEAEQVSLGRRVALKVLPPHRVDPIRLRRFEREARAAGRLHHTNIVPVFGFGQEDGTSYYVMQFISGQPLDVVIDELRRLRREVEGGAAPASGPPASVAGDAAPTATSAARSLRDGRSIPEGADGAGGPGPLGGADPAAEESATPFLTGAASWSSSRRAYARNVARVGVQVAEALEYAAGQGVIHRDIKPSNLLMDQRGTIWVTDFGLAKAAGQEDLTGTDDLVGTLRYMAPERLRGLLDRRSDVYALGLTLFEMLALRPAFGGSDRGEILRQITRGEPPRLEGIDPSIPRDLATVVHKAIARHPDDRYQTAGDLAADLNRFLEDRPIAARRHGPAFLAWRWCLRNPAVAALLGVVALLLVGGTAGSSAAAYRLNRLARSAGDAGRVATEARLVADRRAAEGRAVIDFLIDDLLGSAAPDRTLGRTVTVDEVLARADASIAGRFAGQPLVEASIRRTLGLIYIRTGQLDKAERHLARARDLRAAQLGPDHPDTLASMHDLALVLRDTPSRWDEARDLLGRVLAARRRVLGPDHPDTLASMDTLALLARDRSDLPEARALFERVLEARRRVLGPEDPYTLDTMNSLAWVLRFQARRDEARLLIERVVEAGRRTLGPEHPLTLDAMENAAQLLLEENRLGEARALFGRVQAARRRVLGPDHPDTHGLHCAIATTLAGQGRWEQAAARYEEVFDARPDHFGAQFALALLRLHLGDPGGYRRHSANLLQQVGVTGQPREAQLTAWACSAIPQATEDPARPLELARRALEANPDVDYFQMTRGMAEYRAGHAAAAVAWLEPARGRLGWPDEKVLANLFLALAYRRLDRPDDALRALAEARRLIAENNRLNGPDGGQGLRWGNWLVCEIVLREAEQAVEGVTRPTREDPKPPDREG
jgi:eukaryotic-like serine/threonine-protein kinase